MAELRGRAAHAGVRPEDGRNAIAAAAHGIAAMRIGRLDPETTANVGTIAGGTAQNVVAERCKLVAEARSIDPAKAEALVSEMVDHLRDAANASECDLDVTVEQVFKGYRTRPNSPQVVLAERALRAAGYESRHIVDRRRLRRQRARGAGVRVYEPRRRHTAQPPARRTDQRRCAGRHVRSGDRSWSRRPPPVKLRGDRHRCAV